MCALDRGDADAAQARCMPDVLRNGWKLTRIAAILFFQKLTDRLERRFPKSVRVQRLHGRLLECRGRHKEAAALYNRLLDDDATLLVSENIICNLCKCLKNKSV